MKRIDELFTVTYGVNLELNSLTLCKPDDPNAVYFVSRSSQNHGISAIVERIADIEPIQAGTLSVAGGGSVLETFLQPFPYYSGRDLYYLTPIVEMSDIQKLYYCSCIKSNKYRYNYGRQANKTLKEILVPDLNEIPSIIAVKQLCDFSKISNSLLTEEFSLHTRQWLPFRYDEVFNIQRGSSLYLQDMRSGIFPYVSASSGNNGVSGYVDVYNREGNQIVVNYDGSIAEAFYHEGPFLASEKVVSLSLLHYPLNKYIAFFIITLIRQEKFRYNYGLKWSVNKRMKSSIIKLPVKIDKQPDYEFMEEFVKSIPYSANI